MKRHVILTAACAAALGTSGAAWSQQSSTQSPQPGAAGQSQELTVTGCLIPSAAPTAAGTPGISTAAGFMLMSTPAAAPGTPAASPISYAVLGGNQAELQRLANSRVEIHGRVAPAATPPTSPTPPSPPSAPTTPPTPPSNPTTPPSNPPTPPTPTGTSGTMSPGATATSGGNQPAMQQLRITSVRQVASKCGGL